MSFQTHVEAILKPYRCHITIVGTNMALIWLRYGFDMAFKGVIWELYLSIPGEFRGYLKNGQGTLEIGYRLILIKVRNKFAIGAVKWKNISEYF